jgi:D-alanyl-D-alanine carboxypeptidase (penicillin-binding protein 5/6)
MPRPLLTALLCVALALPASAQDPTPRPTPNPVPIAQPTPTPAAPQIAARSYVLMDFASGRIIASREPDLRVEPASITKLMTSYIAADWIRAGKLALDEEVVISEYAWRTGGAGTTGSTSFLKLGSRVSVSDLLHGMIVQSGNDASIALAERIAGTEAAFADLMNEYAARLGMTGTRYANATGLPDDDLYTTARDVALLARSMIREFPEHYRMYSVRSYTLNGITQSNRNSLLWRNPEADGIKTGHTSRAGFCLVSSAKRGDTRMIAVVMGTESERARADQSDALLRYGLSHFEARLLYARGDEVAVQPLWKGAADSVRLVAAEDVLVSVPRGKAGQVEASLRVPTHIEAPIAAGSRIGTVRVSLDDELLAEAAVTVAEDVPAGGYLRRAWHSLRLAFAGD